MAKKKLTFSEIIAKKKLSTKTENFMGEPIEVKPLSVKEVRKFQNRMKETQAEETRKRKEAEDAGLEYEPDDDVTLGAQRDLIRMAVIGAEDMDDDALDEIPLSEMVDLGNKILEHAGVVQNEDNQTGNA